VFVFWSTKTKEDISFHFFLVVVMWKKWYFAAQNGLIFEVSSLLRDHPEICQLARPQVPMDCHSHGFQRWSCRSCQTAFGTPKHQCQLEDKYGQTPLSKGCQSGHVTIVEVLLKDPRVDVSLDDDKGRTPLWYASYSGKHDVIEFFCAMTFFNSSQLPPPLLHPPLLMLLDSSPWLEKRREDGQSKKRTEKSKKRNQKKKKCKRKNCGRHCESLDFCRPQVWRSTRKGTARCRSCLSTNQIIPTKKSPK